MATSLAQQLKNLAVPQTTAALSDERSRASILFNPKEAATRDRRAIYDIGLSGLQELMSFNPAFSEFQHTLFDEASLDLERAVEKSDVNKLLDQNINKFLRLLSPYFLLRPAHMCLEWLLRRFHINNYNCDAVMALILPYHETNTFVLMLKTLPLHKNDANWDWLRPMQKNGLPVPKSAIINRAASTPAFLKFICRSTQKAIKQLGPRASQLQTQINFYSTVLIGALQIAQPVQDWHITSIIESLLKGLKSDTVDFVASAYVIVAQLISRTTLKPKVSNTLLELVANCTFERLHTKALLLLILILDKQHSEELQITPNTMLNLICQKWLITSLAALAKENIATQFICMPLIRGAVAAVRAEQQSSKSYQDFVHNLISEVSLPTSRARQFIDCFLDTYVETKSDQSKTKQTTNDSEDTIVIDSDDEMEGGETNFKTWYTQCLELLERRYPEAFDQSVKEALSCQFKNSNRRKALKLALGLHLSIVDDKAKRIYEKLYHYNPDLRLSAVQALLENLNVPNKRERSLQLLRQCIADRINDDNTDIVVALLELPTAELADLLGAESFAKSLCSLLRRVQVERHNWLKLLPNAVQHLTSATVISHYDNNLLLLALMPYLFPTDTIDAREHSALLTIIASNFSSKVQFLGQLRVCEDYQKFNLQEHRQHFLDVIASVQSKQKQALTAATLLQSIEQHGGARYLREASQFTHLLLLLTAYSKRKLVASESLNMLQRIASFSTKFKFRSVVDKLHNENNHDHVPLQLYADFLQTLINNTNMSTLTSTCWTQPNDELKLCLLLLDILSGQVFAERCDAAERKEWSRSLKECMNLMLPEAQHKFDFLSNFYIYDSLSVLYSDVAEYASLRLRSFILLQALLKSKPQLSCSLLHVVRLANACSSKLQALRLQALETLQLLPTLEPHLALYVQSLLARHSELSMDHEQYALIFYTILEPVNATAKEKLLVAKLRREMLALLGDESQPARCTAALLQVFKHLTDETLLTSLLPLGLEALKHITSTESQELKQLQSPYSDIYKAVVERFNGDVLLNVLRRKPLAWDLVESSFAKHEVYIQLENKLQPLPCVLLNALTSDTFERLQSKHKLALLQMIIHAATESDNDSIFLAAHKLFKRCILDCIPLVGMLFEMSTKCLRPKEQAARRRSLNANQLDLTSTIWKEGMTLLELIENKKHLLGAELLIPPLFELLQACLTLEEHSAAEYPKQLILSCLLHCCQTAEIAGIELAKVLPESCFRIEQVVQCLRSTQNPQTQQHALLFLTRCASLYPQQVLHKIVEIFTFVGSTVARHDDAFSLHIIDKVVVSIIPTLLQQPGQQERLILPVLKVFSDICVDVPLHRRLPLYATLFSVLEPKQNLWQFLCIVFEAHVLLDQNQKAAPNKTNTRLEFVRELTLMFEQPEIILATCIHLLDYLAQLPVTASEQTPANRNSSMLATEHQLFDVRMRTFKQLRHYKYLIMDYLSTVTSCEDFRSKLQNPTPTQLIQLKPYYGKFILKTLAYVTTVNKAIQSVAGTSSLEKYWRVMANQVHDVLDNAIGLLSPEYCISIITELLQHDLIHVRTKSLELLVNKLTPPNTYFAACELEHFGVLFAPLSSIIETVLNPSTPNEAQLQQAALQAVQLLVIKCGRQYLAECRELLATLTRITKRRASVPKAVLGNVVLTLVEICAHLKAHALAQLPKFMPQLTELLKEQVKHLLWHAPDFMCTALVTALHKLFGALPLFLGPYLVDLISSLLHLSKQLDNELLEQDKRTQSLKLRLGDIWSSLAKGLELRTIVPAAATVSSNMMESKNYSELSCLMQVLLQCIKLNSNAQLQVMQTELGELFLQALAFRENVCESRHAQLVVEQVEASTIEAFVAWILKLSEQSFRPMYSRVHQWALQESTSKEATLTYFHLTIKIAEALKSLFVLFADNVIKDATTLLREHYIPKKIHNGLGSQEIYMHEQLVAAILRTLHHVFLYNTNDYVNRHRFNLLMPPIVDQLDNYLVLRNEELQQLLITCIAQLAVAGSSDVFWKQLNSQVLLKTRAPGPKVRILAFKSCVAIARKLGESFAPLLPETVPFIAELLEDEVYAVESNTRSAVQELETILGEPIQKYL